MLFDSSKPLDCQSAITRLNYLIENKKVFEIVDKKPIRSLNQNRFQHLLFSWFAINTGYTADEVKQTIYKQLVNPELFYQGEFETKLGTIQRWRSTADLNAAETTLAIERFRNYSSLELGLYLPEPSDLAMLQEIENEVKKQKQYL